MVKIHAITHDAQSRVMRLPIGEHAFSRARQFQRAFNASKLQKIFAKPYLDSLSGHSDGVTVLAKCPSIINQVISGAQDGQIKVWDVANRQCLISSLNHEHAIRGVSFSHDGRNFVSSSQQSIHLYDFSKMLNGEKEASSLAKYLSKVMIGNVDHSPNSKQFATSGQIVQIWSYERTRPIYKLEWNCDSIIKVKYNPADPNILCGTASDRSVILYDIRGQSPIQKVFLPNKSSCVSFNPIEPINLVLGNDDSNCYSFDIRRMEKPRTIHKDHIGAITDIDYSPTGSQFVTGSFDRTVRIFGTEEGRSKQVYHAKRMQIVNAVLYTVDSHYILSGSEDMNVRIWKSQASRPIGTISERQKRSIEYRQALIKKYSQSQKIKRIIRHHHLPKYILNAKKRKDDQNTSHFRKKLNRQANTGIKDKSIADKQKLVQSVLIQNQQKNKPTRRRQSQK